MKKILALVLSLAMMLGLASCAKKVEVPSKSDVKKAAKEEYDMDFKVDSEDISDDEKDAEWVLISKDGTLQVTVTLRPQQPRSRQRLLPPKLPHLILQITAEAHLIPILPVLSMLTSTI